ncbi:MAG: lytic murein transglycosylase [Desulfovibrio sp.]|nr:lytic murein transglycosylase [Desulfovibrio sp.]MCA1985632.1 lytic murein transglycosylase [Desulfovibrio sp.]
MRGILLAAAVALVLVIPGRPVHAAEAGQAGQAAQAQLAVWRPLIQKLTADGVDKAWLERQFSRPEAAFTTEPMVDKIQDLYHKKFGSALVRDVQHRLKALGYLEGKADGIAGPGTRMAIRRYEHVSGLPLTGRASEALLIRLRTEKRHAPPHVALPPEPEGPPVYRTIVTPERLAEAVAFYTANLPLLRRIEAEYGVPPHVTTGLLTVETRVGLFLGEAPAFRTLASMALCEDVSLILPSFARDNPQGPALAWMRTKTREKALWAYRELKALIVYARNAGKDPLAIPGSIYGAIGIAQFMPTNALKFGVDGNRDGVVDLFTLEDALHSMGNFMKGHGWRGTAQDRALLRRVLYRYNPSVVYVNTIMHVADHVQAQVPQ